MAKLDLININKLYESGSEQAHIIKDANLTIEEGEFVVFVGPSGCGKSTMLRMIAGLEDISSGELRFDGKKVNSLSPSERGIGMVFQSYALYPHKTVKENIAFGVKYTRNWPRKQVQKAVADIVEALELTHLLEHRPGQLSGGQRQRVAIGRALIRQPNVFLLDEPLSNLDAGLRVRMRLQIAKFHQQFRSTTVYVTHDQVEAMTLADKVVVLNQGGIEQVGSPLELYHFPNTLFVAEFIGSPKMNLIEVKFIESAGEFSVVEFGDARIKVSADGTGLNKGQSLKLGVRPEDIQIGSDSDICVTVRERELLGAESVLYTELEKTGETFLVRCPGTLTIRKGEKIFVKLSPNSCHLFKASGESVKRTITPESLFTNVNGQNEERIETVYKPVSA